MISSNKAVAQARVVRQSALLILALAGVLAISSCNVGPKYAKPTAPAPQAYKEAVPKEFKEGTGWKLADPKDDQIRGNWWELYGEPELNSLEVQVRVSNQTIAQAEASFRQARAIVHEARSQLYPTLSVSPSFTNSRASSQTRNLGTSVGNVPVSTTGGVINAYSLPFDLSYQVDLWHKVRNQIAENAFQAQASAGDLATALLSVQTELAQDYFEVRSLDAQKKVLDDTATAYRETLRLTTARYNGGIASDEDVSQAKTQLDTAIAQATDLGVARAQYEHAIAMLIGKTPSDFSLPVAEFKPNPPPVPVGIPSELLERRPDIAAAERRVAAANAQIGVDQAAYYPNLTLSASAGLQAISLANWFTWPARFWSVGPTLGQTLFDGGLRRATTEADRAAYDGTVANYRQTVLTSFQGVEDNLAALRILAQEVVEQHTAVSDSQHTLRLATVRYTGGVDSYLNVITAQTSVLNNELAEINIQLRQMTSSVQLVKQLGGGWSTSQLPSMQDLTAKQPKTPANPPGGSAPPPNPNSPSN
jgi:NodT family efflux transporter outer membrane factor (OMF) lipoprotein